MNILPAIFGLDVIICDHRQDLKSRIKPDEISEHSNNTQTLSNRDNSHGNWRKRRAVSSPEDHVDALPDVNPVPSSLQTSINSTFQRIRDEKTGGPESGIPLEFGDRRAQVAKFKRVLAVSYCHHYHSLIVHTGPLNCLIIDVVIVYTINGFSVMDDS